MSHPRTLTHVRHLSGRMLGSLRAAPLTPREEAEVAGLLPADLVALFWDQPVMDQRHGIDSARYLLARRPGDQTGARAALLHDVGKRRARLGVPGRVTATLLALVGIPAPGRLGAYLKHAAVGAGDLAAAGADPLVVAYARHQDGERPGEVPPPTWEILRQADGEKPRPSHSPQYDGE